MKLNFVDPMQIMTEHKCKWILYTVLFSPRVIFILLHLQMVSPHLNFTQTQLCTKEILWYLPSLKFAR